MTVGPAPYTQCSLEGIPKQTTYVIPDVTFDVLVITGPWDGPFRPIQAIS